MPQVKVSIRVSGKRCLLPAGRAQSARPARPKIACPKIAFMFRVCVFVCVCVCVCVRLQISRALNYVITLLYATIATSAVEAIGGRSLLAYDYRI